ncbi:MAG: hypothetical protein RL109_1745 [Pseudomonadota bacterium]
MPALARAMRLPDSGFVSLLFLGAASPACARQRRLHRKRPAALAAKVPPNYVLLDLPLDGRANQPSSIDPHKWRCWVGAFLKLLGQGLGLQV